MSKPNRSSVKLIFPPEPAPGPLKMFSLYSLGMGTMLGVGVLVYIPTAASSMGARAVWIMPLIVLMTIPYVMHYIFYSSTVRSSGGELGIVAAGNKAPWVLGVYQCSKFLPPVYIALFAQGFAKYFCQFVPGTNEVVVSIVMLAVFLLINIFGASWMSKVQNIMIPLLYIGLAAYVILALVKGDFSLATKANVDYSINGFQGFKTGAFLLYSMSTGYVTSAMYGRLAENPKKDIPKAIGLSVVTTVLIYGLLMLATVVVLPIADIGTTLVNVAQSIFPYPVFIAWMILIPMLLIATSVNGYYGSQVEALSAACTDGWLPASWNAENKYGSKWKLFIVVFLMGCVPLLIGMQISDLAAYMTLMFAITELINYYYLFKMPTLWKEQWEKSKFHVPKFVYFFFIVAAIVIKLIMSWTALTTMQPKYLLFTGAYIAASVIWCMVKMKTGKAKMVIQVWSDGKNIADPANLESSQETAQRRQVLHG